MKRNSAASWALLCATILLALIAMPVALLAASPRPEPGQIALVVAPPWAAPDGAAGVVVAAGGQEIGPLRAPFAVLAVLDTSTGDVPRGAWAVFDGRWIAALCGREGANGDF